MNILKAILSCAIVALLMNSVATAQERSGLCLGQHNSVNTTLLNPASLLSSPHQWTANLAGAHLFASTDYAYINKANLLRIANDFESISTEIVDNTDPEDLSVIYKNTGKSYVDLHSTALGPGFQLKLNDKTNIGFSIRGRFLANAYKIPEVANYPTYTNLDTATVYTATPFNGNAAAYSELNFHFAHSIATNITSGVTAKYLTAFESMHFQNNISFDLSAFNNDNVDVIEGGSFDLYHSNPEENSIEVKGHGIGVDLGIQLKDIFNEGTDLGISLIDLGIISVTGSKRSYGWEPGIFIDGEKYGNITEAAALNDSLVQDFTLLSSEPRYSTVLPTALSIQVQQKLNQHFSLAGYWVQRLKVVPNQLARSNSLNVTGLYERKHFSAFLPLTLYNYSELNVGAAVRLAYLTIGSDNVLSMFGQRDFNGSDIYVNIQIYPFKLKGRQGNKGKGDKNVQCFDF